MFGEYKNNADRIPEGIQWLRREKRIYLYGNDVYAKTCLDTLERFQISIDGILVSKAYWKEDSSDANITHIAEDFLESLREPVTLVAGYSILMHPELTEWLLSNAQVSSLFVLHGCEILWGNGFRFPDSRITLIDNYYEGLIRRDLNFWYFQENYAAFRQTYDWLEDDTSRETMDAYLRGHIELTNFPTRHLWKFEDVESQYFPEDIIHLRDDEVFVDCGAYIGDTLESFLRRTDKFQKYYALEPDKRRFEELREKLQGNAVHIPVGAWNEKGCLHFSMEGLCGVISDGGGGRKQR